MTSPRTSISLTPLALTSVGTTCHSTSIACDCLTSPCPAPDNIRSMTDTQGACLQCAGRAEQDHRLGGRFLAGGLYGEDHRQCRPVRLYESNPEHLRATLHSLCESTPLNPSGGRTSRRRPQMMPTCASLNSNSFADHSLTWPLPCCVTEATAVAVQADCAKLCHLSVWRPCCEDASRRSVCSLLDAVMMFAGTAHSGLRRR